MIPTTLCLLPTATLFLENLANEGCLSDRALLLSVYPLTVGRRFFGREMSRMVSLSIDHLISRRESGISEESSFTDLLKYLE